MEGSQLALYNHAEPCNGTLGSYKAIGSSTGSGAGATLVRFLAMAEDHGMPVKYLRTVLRGYTVKYRQKDGTSYTETTFNNLQPVRQCYEEG